MKNNLLSKLMLVCVCEVFGFAPALSQTSVQTQDPGAGQYIVPYALPSPESIKDVIQRVYHFFDAAAPFHIIDKQTGIEIKDMNKLNPNADLDKSGNDILALWGYTMGVTYAAMVKASFILGDNAYRTYPNRNMKFFFDWLPYFQRIDTAFGEKRNAFQPVIHTGSLDDCGAMGAALIKMYKTDKDPRYLPVINHIASYISNKQFRLSDGTLARQRPQAQSVWADDAYMSIPFLAQMGDLLHETKYFDDAMKQILQLTKYLFKPDRKLFDHGTNIGHPGDINIYWGRANGWMIMAIEELLDVLPENYKGRDELIKILQLHAQGIAESQGPDGLWHNLLDKSDSFSETSCSAMFVYAIAHGINKGWIDCTYGPVAVAGWNALATKVTPDGQVEGTCWGTTFANDLVYYYHRPTSANAAHGYGPVLFAAAEMVDLLRNDKIVISINNRAFLFKSKTEVHKQK